MQKLEITKEDIIEFTQLVRKIKFLVSMHMGVMEKILGCIMLYEYKKGEKVCKQGEIGDSFYVVYSGKLSVTVKKGFFVSAKEIAVLGRGDFFGEIALLDKVPRTATVTCEEDSKLFALLADNFEAALQENPFFAEEIKRLAAERKYDLSQQINK